MAAIKEWFGAYNVIFNWIDKKYGYNALEDYWKHLAETCFNDVIEKFKIEGIECMEQYFKHAFDMDDGQYLTKLEGNKLIFEVVKCPDYEFMESSKNKYFKPVNKYCKHHEIINSIIAYKSGYEFQMTECDNNGKCKWTFKRRNEET